MRIVLLGMVFAVLAACGGGGGSAGGSGAGDDRTLGGTPSGAAVAIDIATTAPSAETVIYGVELTLSLPAGVTVLADPATGVVATGSFSASDAAALSLARYLPATATTPAKLSISVADGSGFLPGALATVICNDASGGTLSASALDVPVFITSDRDGNPFDKVSWQLSVRKL